MSVFNDQVFKQPRHGKSTVDAAGGRFKCEMRKYEQQKGSFYLNGIDDFISEAANGHQCFYDEDKQIYKVNIPVSNVQLNDGSMSYNPTVFNQLRDKPVVRDGLVYRSGIREIHSIKVVKNT